MTSKRKTSTIQKDHDFSQAQIMALGVSPSDKGMFEMSGLSIAVNPKGDIAEYADFVIKDNLRKVIQN